MALNNYCFKYVIIIHLAILWAVFDSIQVIDSLLTSLYQNYTQNIQHYLIYFENHTAVDFFYFVSIFAAAIFYHSLLCKNDYSVLNLYLLRFLNGLIYYIDSIEYFKVLLYSLNFYIIFIFHISSWLSHNMLMKFRSTTVRLLPPFKAWTFRFILGSSLHASSTFSIIVEIEWFVATTTIISHPQTAT